MLVGTTDPRPIRLISPPIDTISLPRLTKVPPGTGDQEIREFAAVSTPVRFISASAGFQSRSVAVAEGGYSSLVHIIQNLTSISYRIRWNSWAWGSDYISLGNEVQIVLICVPTQIPNTQSFITVSCGGTFTLALDSNGKIHPVII
jgi:hypothetical protein